MYVVDTNVLLYAINRDAPQHPVAREWLEKALTEPQGVGFAWQALLGFLRLCTRPGILPTQLSVPAALGVVNQLLAAPSARIVHPTDQHAALVGRLLLGAGTAGNLVGDAHLAALSIEHGATLVSFDRDFSRFAGVSLELLTGSVSADLVIPRRGPKRRRQSS